MALLLQLDAAEGTSNQTQWHELEAITVFDVTRNDRRVELGLDAKQIRVRLGEMLVGEIRRECPIDILERELEEARSHRPAEV